MDALYNIRTAPQPRFSATDANGYGITLGDLVAGMTLEQRTCECIMWAWDAAAGCMVEVDRATVVL